MLHDLELKRVQDKTARYADCQGTGGLTTLALGLPSMANTDVLMKATDKGNQCKNKVW